MLNSSQQRRHSHDQFVNQHEYHHQTHFCADDISTTILVTENLNIVANVTFQDESVCEERFF